MYHVVQCKCFKKRCWPGKNIDYNFVGVERLYLFIYLSSECWCKMLYSWARNVLAILVITFEIKGELYQTILILQLLLCECVRRFSILFNLLTDINSSQHRDNLLKMPLFQDRSEVVLYASPTWYFIRREVYVYGVFICHTACWCILEY